jgi:acetyl esterase
VLADYRLGASHGGAPQDGVEDARDAIDWIRTHAGELGIDLAKLVIGGASSGAHVALAAVMDPDRRMKVDPAAMVLFSPIVNVVRKGVVEKFADKRMAKLASPLHQVRKGLPPMVVFHGTDDRVQGIRDVELFARKLRRKKNRCELFAYEGERSSFFNFNVNEILYEATLNTADDFLVRAGLLAGEADGSNRVRLESWR